MEERELESRLSLIATHWSVLAQAHEPTDRAAAARQELMARYCGAIYRYLLAAVRDHHAAEDLTQEFALRFVRGLFQHANPEKGRFRDYVKTALFHLVDDHRGRLARQPPLRSLEQTEPVAAPASESERTFVESWRAELLARTWSSLAEDSPLGYEALRLRVEQPELSSQRMAEVLTDRMARPVAAAAARQMLHRSRERFAELLIRETTRSLGLDGAGQLEEELAELNLLRYCQPLLDRRE